LSILRCVAGRLRSCDWSSAMEKGSSPQGTGAFSWCRRVAAA
jgi:hypothetical protein